MYKRQVYDTITDLPAEVNGYIQVGLSTDDADDLADLLNRLDRSANSSLLGVENSLRVAEANRHSRFARKVPTQFHENSHFLETRGGDSVGRH